MDPARELILMLALAPLAGLKVNLLLSSAIRKIPSLRLLSHFVVLVSDQNLLLVVSNFAIFKLVKTSTLLEKILFLVREV